MISETILYIGLAQSLFAAFVLATKRKVETSDRILIACLLVIALKFVLFTFHQQHSDFFDLQFSMGLVPLTFGPFLYLYTVYLVDGKNKFKVRDLLHAIPLLTLTFLYFTFFKDVVDFKDTSYFENDNYLWVRVLFGLVVFSSIMTYLVLTFIKLRLYRKKLKQELSYSKREDKLLWLNFIFTLFAVLFTSYFITGGINAFTFEKVVDTSALSHIGLTVIAFAVSYFGLRQNPLGHQPAESFAMDTSIAKKKQKFSAEEAEGLIQKLESFMRDKRPYINPDLTLSDLAGAISIGKNDLTELLNIHIGKNFFSYINTFRLEEVIKKFENTEYDHYTIIAIAYESGFNSKSTFNNLFKQETGQTPSDFRKQVSNSQAELKRNEQIIS